MCARYFYGYRISVLCEVAISGGAHNLFVSYDDHASKIPL